MNHGTIKSVDDFNEVVSRIQEGRIFFAYTESYRGHSRDTYTLTPNLARKINSPGRLAEIEKDIFEEFKTKMLEAGKADQIMLSDDAVRNEWEWVGQAQHYRLPTRFLDWTIKPEIALFFAVENTYDDDSDGQFWIFLCPNQMFKTDGDEQEFFHQNPFHLRESIFLNPAFFWNQKYTEQIAEQRREFQYGRFSVTPHDKSVLPLEENVDINQFLRKFIIPKESKPILKKYLKERGITTENIYVKEDDVINKIIAGLRAKYGV